MVTMYKSAPATGVLYNAEVGFGSTFAGDSSLPRSIASDGRRWVLFFHVFVHLAALGTNIASTFFMFDSFPQDTMRAGTLVATIAHGVGILSLLALAASELKQVAFVVSMALIYSFLLTGVLSTSVMAVFTFRSDDKVTEPYWLYAISVYLQTLGIAFLTACSLNMAANGDVSITKAAEPAAASVASA